MPDDRTWTWYVGVLQGWGDCIWQQVHGAECALRYITRVLMGPQGIKTMRVPFGCKKGAEVSVDREKIVAMAEADDDAINAAMACYGLKTIFAAGAADIEKAPNFPQLPVPK